MRGDELRKINQNGMLPLIYAHLFSLQIMREVFARQVAGWQRFRKSPKRRARRLDGELNFASGQVISDIRALHNRY